MQTLEVKNNCPGAFVAGELILEPQKEIFEKFSMAWKHTPALLDDQKYSYLFLYLRSQSKSLLDFLDNPELYIQYKNKMNAHRKALISAKVEISEHCFFETIPKNQMTKWLSLRQKAMEKASLIVPRPDHYEILHKAHVLTEDIFRQDILFNSKKGKVKYNIFGSATGRLTTEKGSVPIMTLKKEDRDLIKPMNDAFVELDLNAAEIRMLLALSGKPQPPGDIHDWVAKEIYHSPLDREKVKAKTFAWLYNFSAPKSRLDKIFSRQIFRDFYNFEKNSLTTPFGRTLEVEERKAQNYLLQSTTSDQVIENAYKIHKLLLSKKSKIAFTLHDSIVLDMSREDVIMLKEIKKIFENTRWGNFMSTCKVGKNFGSLKELKI